MFDAPRLQKKKIPGNRGLGRGLIRGLGRILGRGLIRGRGLRMPPKYKDKICTN